MIEHIDIGGPTLIRAAAKNHAFVAVVVRPESYDAVDRGAARDAAACISAQTRESLATEAFGAHRPLRRRDLALVRRARGRVPAPLRGRVREGARPLLRREPAPARRLLRGGRDAHAPARAHGEAARQGALVQQPARPRLRPPPAARVRAAGGCAIIKHNNPCGVRRRRDVARGLRARARLRPAERLRRRRRASTARSTSELAAEAERELRRAAVRARLRARGARDPPERSRNVRIIEDSERRKGNAGERDMRRVDRRPAAAGPRQRPRGARARWRS